MKRVVIDTNIVISAYAFGGKPLQAIKEAFYSTKIFVSKDILDEYQTIAIRLLAKKKITESQARILLAAIASLVANAKVVIPKKHFSLCRDPKDDHILACCIACQADFLITGDCDLLVLDSQNNEVLSSHLRIVTATQFLTLI